MPSTFPGTRVLLVEDELLVSWTTQDVLEALGCTVIGPAASVSQALETIAAQAIDAAVLDLNLSGELSYPIADSLASRGVPYVFLTGYGAASIRKGYGSACALQKPLRRGDLVSALAGLLAPSRTASG
jgi:CheY-like chemotaxis protein